MSDRITFIETAVTSSANTALHSAAGDENAEKLQLSKYLKEFKNYLFDQNTALFVYCVKCKSTKSCKKGPPRVCNFLAPNDQVVVVWGQDVSPMPGGIF